MEFRERLHVFLARIDAFLNLSDLFELESLETLFKVIPLLLAQKHLMFTTYHSVVTNFQTRKLLLNWSKVKVHFRWLKIHHYRDMYLIHISIAQPSIMKVRSVPYYKPRKLVKEIDHVNGYAWKPYYKTLDFCSKICSFVRKPYYKTLEFENVL